MRMRVLASTTEMWARSEGLYALILFPPRVLGQGAAGLGDEHVFQGGLLGGDSLDQRTAAGEHLDQLWQASTAVSRDHGQQVAAVFRRAGGLQDVGQALHCRQRPGGNDSLDVSDLVALQR